MSYDVFLSHSHVDKDWARELYDFLASAEYNGRSLRAWLDSTVLDPGELSSERELDSALDRSRRLAIVVAEESLASSWVKHEVEYFLGLRGVGDIVLIRRRSCTIPDYLGDCELIEWPESAKDGTQRERLLHFLRPEADNMAEYTHRHAVRRAWDNAFYAQPKGFDPVATKASGELLKLLLSQDLADLDEEGLALAGFDSAGQFLAEMDTEESYAMKMILGEYLSVAMLRKPTYAQLARSYVSRDIRAETQPSFLTMRNRALRGKQGSPSSTGLLFAVARSGSKLTEVDPSRIDLSTLAAVLHRLDQRSTFTAQESVVAMMTGRTLGKLRSTAVVDALLYALVHWGGNASHVAVAAAVSVSFDEIRDPVIYYTEELERLARDAKLPKSRPPLPRITRLLFDPDTRLGMNLDVEHNVRLAREDCAQAFGAWEPDGNWPELAYAPPATGLVNGPLVGRVRQVTLANMESLADRLGPADIACLTEPRIVDALLEEAGGFLIDDQEVNAPLGQRLRRRGVRFASFGHDVLNRFEDGSVLVLWPPRQSSSPMGFTVNRKAAL